MDLIVCMLFKRIEPAILACTSLLMVRVATLILPVYSSIGVLPSTFLVTDTYKPPCKNTGIHSDMFSDSGNFSKEY